MAARRVHWLPDVRASLSHLPLPILASRASSNSFSVIPVGRVGAVAAAGRTSPGAAVHRPAASSPASALRLIIRRTSAAPYRLALPVDYRHGWGICLMFGVRIHRP